MVLQWAETWQVATLAVVTRVAELAWAWELVAVVAFAQSETCCLEFVACSPVADASWVDFVVACSAAADATRVVTLVAIQVAVLLLLLVADATKSNGVHRCFT